MPLLLTRKAAAAYVGIGEAYFDQLIAPRAVPIMVGRDSRWTAAELERIVQVLQEEARQRRQRPSAVASRANSPRRKASEDGASTSKKIGPRAIYLRPDEAAEFGLIPDSKLER